MVVGNDTYPYFPNLTNTEKSMSLAFANHVKITSLLISECRSVALVIVFQKILSYLHFQMSKLFLWSALTKGQHSTSAYLSHRGLSTSKMLVFGRG